MRVEELPSARTHRDEASPALQPVALDEASFMRIFPHRFHVYNAALGDGGGAAGETRARESPAAPLYAGPAFGAFRRRLEHYAARHPRRLALRYWQRAAPYTLLVDDVEALGAVAERDDWEPFEGKLAAIEELRSASDALV